MVTGVEKISSISDLFSSIAAYIGTLSNPYRCSFIFRGPYAVLMFYVLIDDQTVCFVLYDRAKVDFAEGKDAFCIVPI